MAEAAHALAGIGGLLALAWLASENRRAIPWRAVGAGLALQLALAALFLKVAYLKSAFLWLNGALLGLEQATQAGTRFVFGYLGGAEPPFAVSDPAANFVLAFRALPLVLIISALSALLFHWRVLPTVVRAVSWLLGKTMGVGGVVGLSTAANIFVGMVEAPLFVRPTWRACPAASSLPSWRAAWRRSPAPYCFSTPACSAARCPTRSPTY